MMGCHSHGKISSQMLTVTGNMQTDELELFVLSLADMRPSEAPEWADRDWWRQKAIDFIAEKVGEKDAEGL